MASWKVFRVPCKPYRVWVCSEDFNFRPIYGNELEQSRMWMKPTKGRLGWAAVFDHVISHSMQLLRMSICWKQKDSN